MRDELIFPHEEQGCATDELFEIGMDLVPETEHHGDLEDRVGIAQDITIGSVGVDSVLEDGMPEDVQGATEEVEEPIVAQLGEVSRWSRAALENPSGLSVREKRKHDAASATAYTTMFDFIVRRMRSEGARWDVAEDVATEAAMKVLDKASDLDEGTGNGFVFTVARNLFRDKLRKQNRRVQTADPHSYSFLNVEQSEAQLSLKDGDPGTYRISRFSTDMELLEDLEGVLDQCKIPEGSAAEMGPTEGYVHYELMIARGYDYASIAEHYNVPIGTVGNRLRRGRAALNAVYVHADGGLEEVLNQFQPLVDQRIAQGAAALEESVQKERLEIAVTSLLGNPAALDAMCRLGFITANQTDTMKLFDKLGSFSAVAREQGISSSSSFTTINQTTEKINSLVDSDDPVHKLHSPLDMAIGDVVVLDSIIDSRILTKKEADVIRLHADGMLIADIALHVGSNASTIKSTLHRTKGKIEGFLTRSGEKKDEEIAAFIVRDPAFSANAAHLLGFSAKLTRTLEYYSAGLTEEQIAQEEGLPTQTVYKRLNAIRKRITLYRQSAGNPDMVGEKDVHEFALAAMHRNPEGVSQIVDLTDAQLHTIKLKQAGYTAKEIAQFEGRAKNTIEKRITTAASKLVSALTQDPTLKEQLIVCLCEDCLTTSTSSHLRDHPARVSDFDIPGRKVLLEKLDKSFVEFMQDQLVNEEPKDVADAKAQDVA